MQYLPTSPADAGLAADCLLDTLPWGLLLLGPQGIIQRLNQPAAAWWGQAPAAVQGRLLGQVGAGKLPEAVYAALQQAATGQPLHAEFWLPAAEQWVDLGSAREPTGEVVIYWQDITARKQREQQYQALAENTPDMLTRWGSDLRLRYANTAFVAKAGRPLGALLGRTFAEMGPPADVAGPYMAVLQRVFDTGQPQEHYSSLLTPKGVALFHSRLVPELHSGEIDTVLSIDHDITELQQQAAEALRLQDELTQHATDKYLSLFNSMDEGFCLIEVLFDESGQRAIDYRFLETNPAFERQTGLADTLGRTMRELVPAHEAFWYETYGRVARTGAAVRFEREAAALGKFYDVYAFRIGAPADKHVAVLFSDIEPRKQVEAALRKSEEQFRLFVTASSDSIYKMDAGWQHMLTLEGKSFLADTTAPSPSWLETYIPPADRATVAAAIQQATATRRFFELEHRVFRADGSVGWTFSRAVPVLDAHGEVVEWFGTATDITARKQAEERLRESEQQLAEFNTRLEQRVARRTQDLQASRDLLQSVFDTNLIAMSVMHAVRDEAGQVQDFRIDLVNKELQRSTGRTDLVGKLYAQEYPGIREVGLFGLALRALATGEPQGMEYYYGHEGFDQWFSCMFIKLDDGLVVTNLDITERKTAELERTRNLRLLEQAEAVADLGSWDYNLLNQQFVWSDGLYQLFGLPLGQPVSPDTYLQFVVPEDRSLAKQLVRRLRAGSGNFEQTLRLRVGEQVKTVRLKAVVLHDEAGQPVRVLGVTLNISELQRLETDNLRLRLSQQQALFEAVQQAQEDERRRISESLHNGIGQILYATKLQLDRLPNAPELPARREATRLLSEAIQQTRALSHELTPALLEEFGLEKTLQNICSMLHTPNLHWHCHLVFEEGPSLSLPLQLAVYRLAQELAQNVLKHAHATEATLEVEVLPAWVVLRIEDNGRGFDPAYTNDGLGLRSLRSRVALLGGSVHLTTAPGQGTQCQIRLPLPPSHDSPVSGR